MRGKIVSGSSQSVLSEMGVKAMKTRDGFPQ